MPLLNKNPFVRREPPPNLKETDKVFYSDITNEVFTDYEEYWGRLVLCNAMVWTCELTGRPSLTYTEAIESETKARRCLANVPIELRKPMLYIASLTRRGRYADMSDDVFNYLRDRYFAGEEVEAIVRKHWYDCKVVRIISPTQEEIAAYEDKMAETDDEEEGDEKSDDGIEVLQVKNSPVAPQKLVEKVDDDIEIVKVVKSPDNKKKKDEANYPPFATFKYEVIELEAWENNEPQKHIVTWEQIRRNKGAMTREKCKLFLKQAVQLSQQGFWVIKDSVSKKYNLANTKYEDIFLDNPPKFQETKSKKIPLAVAASSSEKNKEAKKKIRDEKKRLNKEEKTRLKKEEREKNGEIKKKVKVQAKIQPLSEEAKEQRRKALEEEKENRKKIFNEMKEKMKADSKIRMERQKEERRKENDVKKEQKRLMTEYLKEWKKPQEDLDLEDHKDLPKPTPVQCRIPDSMFSEFMMVLEFINVFTELLELKDVYPQGITFDMLEHALVEKEVAGVLNDVFQLLLQAIFTLQEEEDDEVEADPSAEGVIETDTDDKSIKEALRVANRAATWSQQYYGVPLQKVPLDAFTLTEVLRLHLLASGATNVANAQWRHLNRGGYKSMDDPGLLFKLEEPEVLKSLSSQTIFDSPLNDKLKILNVLVGQILTYASARDIIDDNIEKLKELKNKLRLDQYAQLRKEKEISSARTAEKREKRQKAIEKLTKEAEKRAAANAMTGESDKPIELDLDDGDDEDEEEDEEEMQAREERELKNKESRRQDFLKKETELLQQILNMAKGVNIAPLGQDRAYRRYWLFNSLPGLFVEEHEVNPGLCRLEPTPYNPDSSSELSEGLMELFRVQAEKNIKNMDEDKENDGGKEDKKDGVKGNKASGAVNGHATAEDMSETDGIDEEYEEALYNLTMGKCVNSDEIENLKIYGMCTANAETCPVHSEKKDSHKWFFYHDLEDLHTLISALNARGFREKELKSSMEYYKANIESSMRTCPVYKLDPSQEPEIDSYRKSQRNMTTKKDGDVNLNFPVGTPVDEILNLTLRDMILETEDKIYLGILGSVRTDDREAWREAIENGTYKRVAELDFGGRKRIAQIKMDLGVEDNADNEDLSDNSTDAGVVRDLAEAILCLGQAVDTKYLTQPLGETEKLRKKRARVEEKLRKKIQPVEKEKGSDDEGSEHESDEEEEDGKKANSNIEISNNALRTPMERWEVSLMASTNLSQLCLHYATLDNSITWSRSALNARCRICRRKTDAENMLLCDRCDKGHHLYCLKPKLKSIPSGDWFCHKCKPKEKPKSPRKKNRQIYMDESSGEDEDYVDPRKGKSNDNKCYECGRSGTLVCCDTCPLSFHQECADLRKIPRGSWSCLECKFSESPGKQSSKPSKSKVKEKVKEKEKEKVNKENQKIKDNSNKENKEKKKNVKASDKKEPPKKNPIKEKTPNKTSPKNRKRKNERESSEPLSKRPKLKESEEDNTTPKRGRRSLVEEDREYNSPALETVLEELFRHQLCWPFIKPVSKKEAPDYYEIVKKPMDFRTIHGKLYDMKYVKDEEFIADVMLVFQNCQQYNMEATDEYKAGKTMSKYFMKRVRELGLNYQGQRKTPAKKKKV